MTNSTISAIPRPAFVLRPGASGAAPTPLGANVNTASSRSNPADTIELLRQLTQKSLKSAQALGGTACAASMEAIRAMWSVVMAILRWIARIFGQRVAERDAAEKDAGNKEMGNGVNGVAAKSGLAGEIDADANEVKETLAVAAQAGTPEANQFMQALEAAGLTGQDSSILAYAQSPEAFKNSAAPTGLLASALIRARAATGSLADKLIAAQVARSTHAAALAASYTPPVHVQDLVNMFRANRGTATPEQAPHVDGLLAADDAALAITAHSKMIAETVGMMVAVAKNHGADIGGMEDDLQAILGDEWVSRLDLLSKEEQEGATAKAVSAAGAVTDHPSKIYSDVMGRIGQQIRLDDLTTQQAAAAFLDLDAPVTPVGTISARDRLRILAAAAQVPSGQSPANPIDDADNSNIQRPTL